MEASTIKALIGHLEVCSPCSLLDRLGDYRNEAYAEMSNMADLDTKWLNKTTFDFDPYSFEVSGDALALYKEAQT